jgi:hypothetical protein
VTRASELRGVDGARDRESRWIETMDYAPRSAARSYAAAKSPGLGCEVVTAAPARALLAAAGFELENLIEVRPPAGTTTIRLRARGVGAALAERGDLGRP